MKPKESTERDERIAKLTQLHYSSRQIAAIEGITPRSVQRARRRMGVSGEISGTPMTADECAFVEYLLNDGASYYEVARTVHRTVETISKRYPGFTYTPQQANEVRSMFRQLAAIQPAGHKARFSCASATCRRTSATQA